MGIISITMGVSTFGVIMCYLQCTTLAAKHVVPHFRIMYGQDDTSMFSSYNILTQNKYVLIDTIVDEFVMKTNKICFKQIKIDDLPLKHTSL